MHLCQGSRTSFLQSAITRLPIKTPHSIVRVYSAKSRMSRHALGSVPTVRKTGLFEALLFHVMKESDMALGSFPWRTRMPFCFAFSNQSSSDPSLPVSAPALRRAETSLWARIQVSNQFPVDLASVSQFAQHACDRTPKALIATFRVARLTLQKTKLWLVGVANYRDAVHACLRFFFFC